MANTTIYPYGVGGNIPAGIPIVNDFTTGGADKALSAEAGKTFYNEVFGEPVYETFTKDDATAYLVDKNGNDVANNPYRIRVVLPVRVGDVLTTSCSLGQGVAASVYKTVAKAKEANTNYLQTLSYKYKPSITGTILKDGYLTVSLAEIGNTNFTSEDVTAFLAALNLTVVRTEGAGKITEIEEEIAALDIKLSYAGQGSQDVYIGTLVQKSLTSSGLSDTNADYRVSMASCIVVPREGAALSFRMPNDYNIGIRSGNRADNLSNNDYWYSNGGVFIFSSSVHYYRLCFSKEEGVSTLTVAEVQTLIDEGAIRITVDYEQNIIERNRENEKYVKAIMRKFVSGASNNGSLTRLPVFAHTSDVHGDANRFLSMMDYCDFLGVDAALVTGDMVAYDYRNAMQYINDCADSHTTPVLACTGNHDCDDLTTKQDQYEKIMGYLIEKNGSVTPSGETYPTYFYHDFDSKLIRVISVNLYEAGHSGDSCNFTQEQCEWLIATLASTPANYGVLLLFHSPEGRPSKDNDHAAFYQDQLNWSNYYQASLSGNVFRQIIDAFIGKTSASITYSSMGTSITVSADFTSVASGVEFIAYLSGHLHADLVGYTEGATYKQLNLNICCGVAIYGSSYTGLANLSEVPRGCTGATQDAFNIYAIDRTEKTVRIARVGSNITGRLTDRKFMEIPYAD